VTGGGGVLGQEFCRALVSASVKVAVVDIDGTRAEECVTTLLREFPHATLKAMACNVADSKSVKNMVGEVADHFGAIHILHNNAATKGNDLEAFFTPFEEYSLETWRDIMSVNLDGMFLVAQAVGKQMLKQDLGGSIIQTASIYGMVAPDQRIYEGSCYLGMEINTPAVYSASKAGVIGLTQYLATYWAPHRIRVNTLVPGGVASGQNNRFQQNYAARVPLARMAEPSELTGALLFLASEASSYVTGQRIVVDGGLSCW